MSIEKLVRDYVCACIDTEVGKGSVDDEEAARKSLEHEIKALKRDRERLDWLEGRHKHFVSVHNWSEGPLEEDATMKDAEVIWHDDHGEEYCITRPTIREAIDTAISEHCLSERREKP